MEQVSEFQKQILSEMGIVSWKLRDDDEKSQSPQVLTGESKTAVSAALVQTATSSQTAGPSGLSGLELIKQQMAKSAGSKVDSPQSSAPKTPESTPASLQPDVPPQKVAAVQASSVQENLVPSKPALEFKPEVLVWQSNEIPVSDLTLALETLNIPYQLVDSDSPPVNRFPILIASQKPENLVADKIITVNSAQTKKQLWQALQAFTASQGNAS